MEPAARDDLHLSADPSWLEACKAIGDDLDAIVAQNVAAYDTLGGQGERNRKRGTIVYLVSFFFVCSFFYLFVHCMVSACVFLYTERSSSTEEEHGDKRHRLLHKKSDPDERSTSRAHEGKVPCEFCSSLFPFDGIMPHQVLCS